MAKAKTKTIQTGKPLKHGLTDKQKDEFIVALMMNNFNISKTCNQMNIERGVYYYVLENDEDFYKKLHKTRILSDAVTNGLLEGITHSDLVLRLKYIDVLSKAGLLPKLLNMEDDTTKGTVLTFKKEDLIGE